MAETALDFVLENMSQLIKSKDPLMGYPEEEELLCVYREMQFLRKFLNDSAEACTEHKEVGDLVAKIRDVTCKVDDIVDSFILILSEWRRTSMSGSVSRCHSLDYQDERINHVVEDYGFDFNSLPSRLFCFFFEDLIPHSNDAIDRIPHSNYAIDLIPHSNDAIHMEQIKSFAAERVGHDLGRVMEGINCIKTRVMEIYEKNMYGIGVLQAPKSSRGASASRRATSLVVEEEALVGMDDVIADIKEQLVAEHDEHLKVIPIIGMPGLGKTTVARKVFNDPFVVYHFHVRAWICVSQEYHKRDLLLTILTSAQLIHRTDDEFHQKDKDEEEQEKIDELGGKLYQGLKGKTYLVCLDDVWDTSIWNDLKIYFPDDNNGSRVMFTSRHVDVAVHFEPHHLRFLNRQESWDLLRMKVFRKHRCPSKLIGIGKKIAEKCQGLPLAILILSGLLVKRDKTPHRWRRVADSVSSYIIREPEQYMATLGLSYNQLPFHLKPCFLYFAAFPEDHEIPVRNLVWLWIAEGFIRKNQQKSLEEIAEGYLMDLVDRSLVVVSRKRSDGGIKTCRVHDLLRDLCLRKAKEENFLLLISRYGNSFGSSSSSSMINKLRRISLHSLDYNQFQYFSLLKFLAPVRTLLFFERAPNDVYRFDVSSVCRQLKLLRVLNLSSIPLSLFPEEIKFLVHLRYLALRAMHSMFQLSISSLWNLETLIIKGSAEEINLPVDILKMVSLRHVYIEPFFNFGPLPTACYPFVSDSLQSIKGASLGRGEEGVLASCPKIRSLKCFVNQSADGHIHFPRLDFLVHLEKLNVSRTQLETGWDESKTVPVTLPLPHDEVFPPSLRCLTLSKLVIPPKTMSVIGSLPNLEVLKLSHSCFMTSRWDEADGKFCKLKYLKFEGLNLKQWNATSDQFCSLQTLALESCRLLEEIPYVLGDILTLEVIKLWHCSKSAEKSAREIQEEQRKMGNYDLKVIIHPYEP